MAPQSLFNVEPLSEEHIYELVRTLALVRFQPEILADVESFATSCVHMSQILHETMPDAAFVPPNERVFENIRQALENGKVAQIYVKLTPYGDHCFTVEPRSGSMARVVHSWQDRHTLRTQTEMSIDDMMGLLERLSTENFSEAFEVRSRLWGSDHAGPTEFSGSGRQSMTIEQVWTGTVKSPLELSNLDKLGGKMLEFHAEYETISLKAGSSAAVGGVFGFLFGAAGALLEGEDWKGATEEGLKDGAFGAIAGAAEYQVAKRFGSSLVRSNVVVGLVFFGLSAVWDVAKYEKHDLTAVELRRTLAEEAGGAAGGIVGGIAAGAGGGWLLGPVGAVVGAIVGGVAGGIAGAKVAEEIDKAIWDEGEDSVMNSYEFFGWHDVKRNTRPVKTAEEIVAAYKEKLKKKPEKSSEENWKRFCTVYLMILLRAMFPEYKKLLDTAENLRQKKTKTTPVIARSMFLHAHNHHKDG